MPGTGPLVVYSVTGFAGYAVLLPVAPLWAVHGGADAAGSGLVNGVLLATTVLVQLAVPALLRRLGHARVMSAGLLLMGGGAALHVASDGLAWSLGCSAVRGAGFGVLTVTGSAVVGHLAPPGMRGRVIGVYGLAVALPNLLLLPTGVAAVDLVGFAPVLLVAALPVLGVPAAVALGRLVDRHVPPVAAAAATRDVPSAGPGLLRAVAAPTTVLLASTLAGGALLTFLPQLTTSGTAGVALLLMGASAAGSRYGAGHLADRGSGAGEVWLGPLLVLTALGTTACAWGARADASAAWLLLGALLCGTGYGALQNLTLVSAFHRAGPGRRHQQRLEHRLRRRHRAGLGAGRGAGDGMGVPGRPRGRRRRLPARAGRGARAGLFWANPKGGLRKVTDAPGTLGAWTTPASTRSSRRPRTSPRRRPVRRGAACSPRPS